MKTQIERMVEFMHKRHTHYLFYRSVMGSHWIKSRRSSGRITKRYTDQELIDAAIKDGYVEQ